MKYGLMALFMLFLFTNRYAVAQNSESLSPVSYLSHEAKQGDFVLSSAGKPVPLIMDAYDFPGVVRVAGYLQNDILRVTGTKPRLLMGEMPYGEAVIIGTIGKSALIDSLISHKKINVDDIKDKWETSLIQVVENPFPQVPGALVIAGSDKRGTIYGMFDLSRQIGISPWHFWSDVPVMEQKDLAIKNGRYNLGTPKVKYRGIFLNDEEPALGRWAVENYGGFNHQFYEKVFELILRLKGNYIWPAMWWAAFSADDPANPELADELGIVLGTTHHEPMMRAHAEWKAGGVGEWNYDTNENVLRKFWREGIERMGNHESIVTLAMRGDGDMAMTAETNTALLERIVSDQRKIIEEVTGKPAPETPQLWALYKEVQDYYDAGMRVPDDVTLLLCDDNWGNIRKLPNPDSPPRKGGYGIYYHFDYVGGPRNYKWLNTSPLPRVWEQMNLAFEHGVDRIWIVNVGDLKPMELPISFFLDFAFDPEAWPADRLKEYNELWAKEQFGPQHAEEIAEMVRLYPKYNGRRKPELLSPETYSLLHFREAERIRDDYNRLAERAIRLETRIPEDQKDAYYQLVLHPITACANLNDMYVTTAENHLYAGQGRSATNDKAKAVIRMFEKDSLITEYYHNDLAEGKWNHMMAQTHIGYTYWQQPPFNSMPTVSYYEPKEGAEMGVAAEGSDAYQTNGAYKVPLPVMDGLNRKKVYIDIFNRGKDSFNVTVKPDVDWLKAEKVPEKITKESRIWLTADWNRVPAGEHVVPVKITGNNQEVKVNAVVRKPETGNKELQNAYIENNGYISMEAANYTGKKETSSVKWMEIPGLGRTQSGMTVVPVTASPVVPSGNSPHLEYAVYVHQPGEAEITVILSPTLNYYNDEGKELAVSVDNQKPQVINIHKNTGNGDWERWVSNNCIEAVSKHTFDTAGKHLVKIWMVDPGLVFQKVIVRTGHEKDTYLGPPESAFIKASGTSF